MKKILLLMIVFVLIGCVETPEVIVDDTNGYEVEIEALMMEVDALMIMINKYKEDVRRLTEANRRYLIDYEAIKGKAKEYVSLTTYELENNERYVYVEETMPLKLAPDDLSYRVGDIESGFLVEVIDKISITTLDHTTTWYHVIMPNFVDGSQLKGWLPVESIVTSELIDRDLVKNVVIRDNSYIYRVNTVEEISNRTRTRSEEVIGYRQKEEGDFVFLFLTVGDSCWVNKEDIFIKGLDE